ncbi:MAG: GRP family sugar transporter [Acidobacteriota bacterium]
MTIPTTYMAALLLCILSMICWGSWANTTKVAPKWRFELYYFDYAIGVFLAALVICFTFGMFGSEITFQDNLTIIRYRAMGYAAFAGVVFNLANMLLVAAIGVAGMSVAFPVGIGLALVLGVVVSYFMNPQGNPSLLFLGTGIILAAIGLAAYAYKLLQDERNAGQPLAPAPETKRKQPVKVSPWKGLVLSTIAGLLMGSFYPLIQMSHGTEIDIGPYSILILFAAGVLASTFIFNIFFISLPVQGKPVAISGYFKGTVKNHLLGLFGGMLWCVGLAANLVAASVPPEVHVGPAVSYGLGQGAVMISTLWGLLYWKEFADSKDKSRLFIWLSIPVFVVGLALISVAPLYTRR